MWHLPFDIRVTNITRYTVRFEVTDQTRAICTGYNISN